jgi:hypothetical protein
MARTKKSNADEKKSKHTNPKGEGKKGGKQQRGGEERNWKTQRREEEAMKGMRHMPGVNGCKKVNDEWTCVKACAVGIAKQFFDKKRSSKFKKRKKSDSDDEEEEDDESDDEDEEDKEDIEEKAIKKLKKKSKVTKFSKKSKDDDEEVTEENAQQEQGLITPISRKLLNAGTSTDSICKCRVVLTSILRMAGIRKAVTCWGVEVGEYDPNSGGPGRETKSCSMAEKQLQSNSHIAAAIASGEYTMQVLMSLTREKVSL